MLFVKRLSLCVFFVSIVIGEYSSGQEMKKPQGTIGGKKSQNSQDLFSPSAEELKFPTTTEEILKSLPKPEQQLEGRSRDIVGIADDLDEKFLEHASKVGAMIQFDYNSAAIKPESLPLLREYGKAFVALKDAQFVIAGHTDAIGSEEFNLDLSRQRAEAIRQFLASEFPLTSKRLMIKPFGELKPIDSNENQAGRAKNRRVEFYRLN
jgi:outer membrane protein OmpA-like peptidoglycan-associated protein